MAEVFAYGEGTVVKLDRPEWSGVSAFESGVIERVAAAGIPVARSHGVVEIDGRCGVVLDRIEGRSLGHALMASDDIAGIVDMAERFTALQASINATTVEALPDLVTRLRDELAVSGLAPARVDELTRLLEGLDDGVRRVCHFDFHPLNVLVAPDGWVVIDWLTAAAGPPLADLARTLVLWGQWKEPPVSAFMRAVRRLGLEAKEADAASCDAWVRVLAGARLAEGFEGDQAEWLGQVAAGDVRLYD
jgi:aminoglycoside phosphotransferase (APT) family kinase protein